MEFCICPYFSGPVFSICSYAGLDAALVKVQKILEVHPTIENKMVKHIQSCARGPPQFSKKRSENGGANENLLCGFAAIPGIAPAVAPRILVLVLLKSRDAIPENGISNSESCSKNTPELSESSENGLFTPRAFFLKLGWSPGPLMNQSTKVAFDTIPFPACPAILLRPDPCSVDLGRDNPKVWFEFCCEFLGGISPPVVYKGRTWAMAVRRGSYKSLFLPNSGLFPWK